MAEHSSDGEVRRVDSARRAVDSAGEVSREANGSTRAQRKVGCGSLLGEFALILVVALVISAVLRAFVFQMFEIPSGSMEHTLEVRDRVAAVKIVEYRRGDVVVFRDPANWLGPPQQSENPVRRFMEIIGVLPSSSTSHLIKRVIGLPGDKVTCCDNQGQISVNGVPLDETSYLYTDAAGRQVKPSETRFEIIVPKDRLFVMGDHRNASGDSRLHLCDASVDQMPAGMTAFVPLDDVVGPAKAIIAPLNRMQGLETPVTFAGVPDTGVPPDAPSIKVNGAECPR